MKMLDYIIDSHAHYDDEDFDADRDALLGSMEEHGIRKIINVGASMESSKSTLALSQKYPFIYAAIGVHPSDTADLSESDMEWLEKNAALEKVVAIGEIGLDYYWDEPDKEIQKKWFLRQLALARKVKKPVIIHSREAALDTLTLMKEAGAADIPGVIHCYSYSKETAREFLEMGYYFGIGGVLTFKNAKKLKEAVSYLPMDRILLETDCPYLSPEPNRGKRNSSLNIPYVVAQLAQIKGISEEEVVHAATENTERLFSFGH
jgi:TatD DNase family protein